MLFYLNMMAEGNDHGRIWNNFDVDLSVKQWDVRQQCSIKKWLSTEPLPSTILYCHCPSNLPWFFSTNPTPGPFQGSFTWFFRSSPSPRRHVAPPGPSGAQVGSATRRGRPSRGRASWLAMGGWQVTGRRRWLGRCSHPEKKNWDVTINEDYRRNNLW